MDYTKNRHYKLYSLLAITIAACVLLNPLSLLGADKAPPRPNIVWIWADNLAYADLGVYGSQNNKTPVIDRLAGEGVRLRQYYIAHTVCSPSRAALLTGRQPFRVGIVDVLRPDGPSGIPADEITLAEALRDNGYATKAIGKWHLGDQKRFLPTNHGFDSYLGLPYSMDMLPTVLYRDDKIIENLEGDKVQSITARYTQEAIRYINKTKRDRPFFLYLAHTLPHGPLNLPVESRKNKGRTTYNDAIEYIDRQTGILLEALERSGKASNTLVVFTSDNGPMLKDGDTGDLRGRIRDAYEGGVRVPFIARWPGKIPTGRVDDTPAIAYDMFPTLLKLAGGSLPADRIYDGQDIWPVLSGEGKIRRQKPFFWVYTDNVTTIRDGRWKYHVGNWDKPLKVPELYDIQNDPGEKRSLIKERPEVAADLQIKIDEFQKQIPKAWSLMYPVRNPAKRKSGVRRK